MMGNMGTHAAAPAQNPSLKYDPLKDFTPIGLAADVPAVIVARKDFPANSLLEFVNYVRAHQDKVSEAHVGVGSPTHTFCTLLQSLMGTATARVSYRGGAQAMNDLLAGRVDFSCISLSGAISHIQSGSLKAMAVGSPERVEIIKDVPTTREAGLPAFEVSTWNALFAPKNLPEDIQKRLADALASALEHETARKRLNDLGFVLPRGPAQGPAALQSLVEREIVRWRTVLSETRHDSPAQ